VDAKSLKIENNAMSSGISSVLKLPFILHLVGDFTTSD